MIEPIILICLIYKDLASLLNAMFLDEVAGK